MTILAYFSGNATTKTYDTDAFDYIQRNAAAIKDASQKLGISDTAIAGAMAEESDAYWDYPQHIVHVLSDRYALSAADTGDFTARVNQLVAEGRSLEMALVTARAVGCGEERTASFEG